MIGSEIMVTKAKNPQLIGIQGKVIDETKHTLTITTQRGNRTIIKDQIEEIQ